MKSKKIKKDSILYDIIQILAFMQIAVIDMIRCSGDGVQWACGNMITGICIGIILLSHWRRKAITRVYGAWIAGGIITLVAFFTAKYWFYYIPGLHYGETRADLINLLLYFIIALQLVLDLVENKDKIKVSCLLNRVKENTFLLFFFLFEILSWVSQYDIHKPWYLFGWMILGFLVPWEKKEKQRMASNMLTGIIVGFWLIQALAFAFRPYLAAFRRYRSMYFNANMYALLCYIAIIACLIKLYELRDKKWLRILMIISLCAIIALQIFTVGRAAILISAFTIVVFSAFVCFVYEKKPVWKWVKQLGICLCGVVVMVPVMYGCIRYLPLVLHRPIYVQDEYLQIADLKNKDSFMNPQDVLDEILSRTKRISGNNMDEEKAEELKNQEPVDPDWEGKNYYLNWDTDYSALDLRVAIWKTFLSESRLFGQKDSNYSEFISPYKQMFHSHNLFIQMIYGYGIIAGILFMAWIVFYMIRTVKHMFANKNTAYGLVPFTFLLGILVFGMYEVVWQLGQITWFLLLFMQLFVMKESNEKCLNETAK